MIDSKNDDSKVKYLKDYIKEKIIEEGTNFISKTVDKLAEEIKKRYEGLRDLSNESIIQFLKMAWNYEEKFQESYGFEDAIKWFKINHPGKKYMACLLKTATTDKKDLPTITSLHHCFIEIETNKPILDGSLPYRVLKTLNLKDDIKNAFGSKDMIILK